MFWQLNRDRWRPTVPFEGEQRTLFSCDVSSDGLTVAAGTELRQDDALILYWCVKLCCPVYHPRIALRAKTRRNSRDPRHPAAPLRKHTSTHSDDITTVHFSRSPERPRDLLSGSTDGLVCISNADEEDEDEAVVYVGNLGSSIAQAGWIPRRAADARTCVWAASDMETFSLWSDEARRRCTAVLSSLRKVFFSDGFPSSLARP
jgi:WD repeat-containing protein 89